MTANDKDLLQLPARAYLRVDEVSRFLGVSTRHVRRLAERGAFVSFRVGTDSDDRRYPTLRLSRQSVLDYVKRAIAAYEIETGTDLCD